MTRPSRWVNLRAAVHRLASSDDELVAEGMAESVQAAGALPIAGLQSRQMADLRGEIVAVTLGTATGRPEFEADLFDGSGHIALVWLGRNHVRGIEVGNQVRLTGRVADRHGQLVIYNPEYFLEVPPTA